MRRFVALKTDWESEDRVGGSSLCACNRRGFRIQGLGYHAKGSKNTQFPYDLGFSGEDHNLAIGTDRGESKVCNRSQIFACYGIYISLRPAPPCLRAKMEKFKGVKQKGQEVEEGNSKWLPKGIMPSRIRHQPRAGLDSFLPPREQVGKKEKTTREGGRLVITCDLSKGSAASSAASAMAR
jgi:hypothetical protein